MGDEIIHISLSKLEEYRQNLQDPAWILNAWADKTLTPFVPDSCQTAEKLSNMRADRKETGTLGTATYVQPCRFCLVGPNCFQGKFQRLENPNPDTLALYQLLDEELASRPQN